MCLVWKMLMILLVWKSVVFVLEGFVLYVVDVAGDYDVGFI